MKLLVLIVAVCGGVWGYPDGAPEESCDDLAPQHFLDPSPGANDRYSIDAEDNGDGTFTVTLSTNPGVPNFKGFFIQARSEATGSEPVGSWYIDPQEGKGRPCPEGAGEVNGVTHSSAVTQRSEVTATFTGEADGLYFMASIVERFDLFYVDIRSDVVM